MEGHDGRPGYRNVVALGLVSFFTDLSTEMILGVLPRFVIEELKATRAALGLMEGVAEFGNYIFRVISGLVSDRLGKRKLFVFTGYLFSGLAKPLFSFARSWFDALTIRTLDRVGKGVRTSPRDALISQSVEEREAGKAFGIHRSLDQLGAVIGPLSTFMLIPLVGARTIFLLSFIPAALALIVLGLFVVEITTPPLRRSIFAGAREVFKGKFLTVLACLSLFNLGAYNFSFVLVRAGELGIALFATPLVYMVINLAHTGIGYPSGVLSDKIGREAVLVLGFLLFGATSLLLMSLAGSWIFALVIAVAFGIFQGMYDTASRAVVPKYAPEELRGTAYGIYYLVVGLSFLVGISLVGYLWDSYGRYAAFSYSLATSLTSAIIIAMIALKK